MIVKFLLKDTYEKLIEYYSKKCDVIMFVTKTDGFNDELKNQLMDNITEVEKKLKASFIKKINRSNWVFHESKMELFHEPEMTLEEFQKQFTIYFYKFTEEVKEYLLSNLKIFTWLNPRYPEDVSFFRKGECLFYTITHEEICDIVVENKEEFEYLKSIGVKFLEKEYASLDKKIYIMKKYSFRVKSEAFSFAIIINIRKNKN